MKSRFIVFLDHQHAGKPSRPTDRGAHGDLDSNGSIEAWEQESERTLLYGHRARQQLEAAGVVTVWLSDGEYSARHRRVNGYADQMLTPDGLAVYLALHLNAGGGRYGLVLYDHRSGPTAGPTLAAAVAGHLATAAPELEAVKHDPASPTSWSRGYSTIRHLGGRVVGLCLEPGFLDQPAHADLLGTAAGLHRIGDALAAGILDYARARGLYGATS